MDFPFSSLVISLQMISTGDWHVFSLTITKKIFCRTYYYGSGMWKINVSFDHSLRLLEIYKIFSTNFVIRTSTVPINIKWEKSQNLI